MNIYEQWVFDGVQKAGLQVFTPYKDIGIDAVIMDMHGSTKRVQIKGSRRYEEGGGWYTISPDKLSASTSFTDLWVFVWAKVVGRGRMTPEFLAISPGELLTRFKKYGAKETGGKFYIYFGRRLKNFREEVIEARGLKKFELNTHNL